MSKANDGTIMIRASEWPSFLYESISSYDSDNEEGGLFRGYLLLRVRFLAFLQQHLSSLHLKGVPAYIYQPIIGYSRSP